MINRIKSSAANLANWTVCVLFAFACLPSFAQAGKPIASVDSVAALLLRKSIPNERVILTGWRTNGDFGAHRILRHVPDSTTATNLGCVFDSFTNGRYVADDCESGEVDVRWFGAIGDGVTDDTAALNAALSYGRVVRVPQGTTNLFSSSLYKTNFIDGFRLELLGTLKRANGGNSHNFYIGTVPSFTNGYPVAYGHSNVVIDGGGIGVFDGNSLNWLEMFPTSSAAIYGGHGLYISGVSGVQVKNLRVRDVPVFAMAIRACKDVIVAGNHVWTGSGNGSTNYNGKNQDGIHLTDCIDAVVENNFVRSCDDNISLTTDDGILERVTVRGNILHHYYLSSTNGLLGVPYGTLGFNVRATVDFAGDNKYVNEVLIEGNLMTGGNGAVTLQHATGTNFGRNITIRGNKIFDKTDLGVAGWRPTYSIISCHNTNLVIEGNEFRHNARGMYFQDNWSVKVIANIFSDSVANPYWAFGEIYLDGPNTLEASGNYEFTGNTFDKIYRRAFQVAGQYAVTYVPRYFNVSFTRNKIIGGPTILTGAGAGPSAVSVVGTYGNLTVSNNEIDGWDGAGIYLFGNAGNIDCSGNSMQDMGVVYDTGSQTAFISTTNGMLYGSLSFNRNSVRNASGATYLRNATSFDVSWNRYRTVNLLWPSEPCIALGIIGDGAGNPDSSLVSGNVVGNVITSTNAIGIRSEVTDAPAYTGAKMYTAGNSFSGVTQAFGYDGAWMPNYVYDWQRSVYGTTSPNSFGSHWIFADSATETGGQSFMVERYNTAVGSITGNNVLSVVNRLQGSGDNAGTIIGASIYSSADRTSPSSAAWGLLGVGRWTSSGGVTNAYGVVGRVDGSGTGVAARSAAVVANGPVISGGGTITESVGLLIGQQNVSGVTRGYGIYQDGTTTTNWFAGQIYGPGVIYWNSGNDGSGSGLDADTVRGLSFPTNNGAYVLFVTNGAASWIAHP